MYGIILVDDEDAHRMIAARVIKTAAKDARLKEAASVAGAKEALQSAPADVKLVVLDLNLAGESGLEVLNWMRSSQQFKSTPVLVVSTSDLETDFIPAYSAGANCYVVKLTSPEGYSRDLAAAVSFLLNAWS